MNSELTKRRIAGVIGPALLLTTASETINLEIWSSADPALVYLNGLVFVLAGLMAVNFHFAWRSISDGLVSAAGVLLICAGAGRMFFPTAEQLSAGPLTYLLIAGLFLYGLTLCFIAFAHRRRNAPD